MFGIFYLIMSVLVGLCAIGRRPGFVVTFLLSLIITPFAMLLILYITKGNPCDYSRRPDHF